MSDKTHYRVFDMASQMINYFWRNSRLRARFFYPQFWNKNCWYGMLGIIRIVCIKKPRRSWASKHCVTNMAADEEAAIAAVIAAVFLVLLVH